MDSPAPVGRTCQRTELHRTGNHLAILLLTARDCRCDLAAQVNGKVAAGDTQGALDSSKKAKMFSFIAIGLGLLGIICYVLFFLIMGVGLGIAGSSSNF